MKQENSQLDFSDRPLLAPGAQQSVWTEIGEAQVTHTIFGRAKVRIIRKHDDVRRALWLVLAVVVIVAVAWQGWLAFQQTEALQSVVSPTPLSASLQQTIPASQPESIPASVTPSATIGRPGTSVQIEISKPTVSQNRVAPSQGLKGNEKVTNPITAQPLVENKLQTPQLVTNNNAAKNQTGKPLNLRAVPASHPLAPVVAAPRATSPISQPAASSPSAAHSLASPLVNEDIPTLSSDVDKKPAEQANTQGR